VSGRWGVDVDAVTAAVREVSAEVVEPRFRALARHEVTHKRPGDVVTIADRECETLLIERLTALLPGVPVVGEEGTHDDPALLDLLAAVPRAWVVDPVDGTSNFAAGKDDYAVMLALVEHGSAVAAWVYLPQRPAMYVAERGSGTYRDGERVEAPRRPADVSEVSGVCISRYLNREDAARVERNRHRFRALAPGRMCAGADYVSVVDGERDLVLFGRTKPWDHAPGTLLVEEVGGRTARLDGSPYDPRERDAIGLLTTGSAELWDPVRTALLT
jgi:fructose-1,6-bisphosphatase/inositol monophosphatase family enzyme